MTATTTLVALSVYIIFHILMRVWEIKHQKARDAAFSAHEDQLAAQELESREDFIKESTKAPEPAPPVLSRIQIEIHDTYTILYGPNFGKAVADLASRWNNPIYTVGLILQRQMPNTPPPGKTYKQVMLKVLETLIDEKQTLKATAREIMQIAFDFNMATGEVIAYLTTMYPALFKMDVTLAVQLIAYKDLGVDQIVKNPQVALPKLSNADLILIGREVHDWGHKDLPEKLNWELQKEFDSRIASKKFTKKSAHELRSIQVRLQSYLDGLPQGQELSVSDEGIVSIIEHIEKTMNYYNKQIKKS